MSLRVLFVTTTYPLKSGDAIPAFVADLARHLVRRHDAQIRVIAPHHPGAAKEEIVDGVHIERFQYCINASLQCLAYGNGIPDNVRDFPRAKFQIPAFFAAMAAAVHRNLDWADLIHAHWVEPAFIASVANFVHRKPLVLTVHSLKPKASRLHRYTSAKADRVLFNSRYTMAQAAAKGYRCNGAVVYQGYDEKLFGARPRTGEIRRALGIPPDGLVVTAVGRMIELKGMQVLAAAADRILGARQNAHIVFAGDGPMRAQVESIARSSSRSGRVHFTGALKREQVAELLTESDIFVNPGIVDRNGRAEGLGITTIEAMACGLAIVGSRAGGIMETITDGVTGVLVPPDDAGALAMAVGRLLNDDELRQRMGEAGREMARNRFTWPALAAEVAKAYGQLCMSRRQRSPLRNSPAAIPSDRLSPRTGHAVPGPFDGDARR